MLPKTSAAVPLRSTGLTLPVGRRAEAAKAAAAPADRFHGAGVKAAPLSLVPAAGKPLASPPALPSWYPQNFDLAGAGEGDEDPPRQGQEDAKR